MLKVIDVARKKDFQVELENALMMHEFNLTIDEDWCWTNSFEAKVFQSLEPKMKTVYALTCAKKFADDAMEMTVREFMDEFGDLFDEFDLEESDEEEIDEIEEIEEVDEFIEQINNDYVSRDDYAEELGEKYIQELKRVHEKWWG